MTAAKFFTMQTWPLRPTKQDVTSCTTGYRLRAPKCPKWEMLFSIRWLGATIHNNLAITYSIWLWKQFVQLWVLINKTACNGNELLETAYGQCQDISTPMQVCMWMSRNECCCCHFNGPLRRCFHLATAETTITIQAIVRSSQRAGATHTHIWLPSARLF